MNLQYIILLAIDTSHAVLPFTGGTCSPDSPFSLGILITTLSLGSILFDNLFLVSILHLLVIIKDLRARVGFFAAVREIVLFCATARQASSVLKVLADATHGPTTTAATCRVFRMSQKDRGGNEEEALGRDDLQMAMKGIRSQKTENRTVSADEDHVPSAIQTGVLHVHTRDQDRGRME